MKKLLSKVVDIRSGEGFRTFAMFAYFFSVMAAYYVVKPATRSLYIKELGASNLPFVYILTALVIGLVVAGWEKLVDRFERHHLVLISMSFFMSTLVAFRVLFALSVPGTPVGFYLWSDIFSVLAVTLFWSFCNEIFQPGEGKRLFGVIGGGGTAGSWAGSRIAASLSVPLGTHNLLLIAAVLLLPTILLAFAVQKRLDPAAAKPKKARKAKATGGQSGYALIRQSRYLTLMVAMMGLMLTTSLFIEQQFQRSLEEARLSTDAQTAFSANRDSWMSVIGFVLQVGFTGHILKRLGILPALLILPVVNFFSSAFSLCIPTIAVIGWAKVFDGSLKYGINQATKEVLYLPTSRDVKYKAKAFIDMFFFRLVKGVAGVVLLVLAWAFQVTVAQLSLLSLACTAAWIFVVFALRREYRVALALRVDEAFAAASLAVVETPRVPGEGDLETRLGRLRSALDEHPISAAEIASDRVAAAFAAIAERSKAPHIYRAYLLVKSGPAEAHPIAVECLDAALVTEQERAMLEVVMPARAGKPALAPA